MPHTPGFILLALNYNSLIIEVECPHHDAVNLLGLFCHPLLDVTSYIETRHKHFACKGVGLPPFVVSNQFQSTFSLKLNALYDSVNLLGLFCHHLLYMYVT